MRTQEEGRASTAIENPAVHQDQSDPDHSTLTRIVHHDADFVHNTCGLRATFVHCRCTFQRFRRPTATFVAFGIFLAGSTFAALLARDEHVGSALLLSIATAALFAWVLPIGRRR